MLWVFIPRKLFFNARGDDIKQYFDLVHMADVDRGLVSRLGYKRIFSENEIKVVDSLKSNNGSKLILRSGEVGKIDRWVRDNNVIGIIIEDYTLVRKIITAIKDNDKLLLFVAGDLTDVDRNARLRNITRMRTLFKSAVHYGVETSLITLAKDCACLLSSLQMVEIAKLIGADEKQAIRMLGSFGERYDT